MKKRTRIIATATLLMMILVFATIFSACDIQPDDHTGQAKPPSGSMEGKNYLDVKRLFEQAGFTNIQFEEIDDLIVGWLHDEGDVKDVSVGGDTDYSFYQWYPVDTLIIIRYHVFPKEDDSDGNQNTGNSNNNASTEEDVLTVDNCPELAYVLSLKADLNQAYIDFAKKYKGRTIKFEGNIAYLCLHGTYTTRYDVLVTAGDYDEHGQLGPTFKFEDVGVYDLDLDTLWFEDEIWIGRSVVITAIVEEYDTRACLFYLDPISVVGR